MKAMRTRNVYLVDGCTEDAAPRERFDRMMRCIVAEHVHEVSCAQLDRIAADQGGQFGEAGHPDVIFSPFRWRTPAQQEKVQEQ